MRTRKNESSLRSVSACTPALGGSAAELGRSLRVPSRLTSALMGLLTVAGFNVAAGSIANAVPLENAISTRPGFSYPLGAPELASYDGAKFDAFKPFASLVSPDLLKVDSFTGHSLGSNLSMTLLSASGAFDFAATDANSNKLGVVDSQGNFHSLVNTFTDGIGSTGSLFQGANDSLKLALKSPVGLFTTDDASNPDQSAHMLAMQVQKDGNITVNPTSLLNTPPLTFSFLAGDIIVFCEDLLKTGNFNALLGPGNLNADFDYNDMVFVVRQNAVPEPFTVSLLGMGMIGAAARRRRHR